LSAPGRSIAYNDRLGLLAVKGTVQELDTVLRTIEALNQVAPQVHIKARFIEVPKKLLAASNFFTNAVAGPMSGIMSDANFRTVLHALNQQDGVETLAEPEVVTTSGRQTQMRATDVQYILLAENGTHSSVNLQPTPVENGPVIDIVPYVLDDGFTVTLTVIPETIEFLGYDPSTNPKSAGFRVQRLIANVNLWDNQTFVLGNLSSTFVDNHGNPASEPKFFVDVEKQKANADKVLLIFVTATVVDAAGNRVHGDNGLPFNPSSIPPQPQPVASGDPAVQILK